MAALELVNLSYKYKGAQRCAVSNANYEFNTGAVYSVEGPSGSGKSTLLSLLAGLDSPTEGEIIFDGVNLKSMDLDRYRRESVAMIFQMFHLFPQLTVMENVCYSMELCGSKPSDAAARAKDILKILGITPEKNNRFPSNLSGGEQQRVAIARCLASGAKIILADEPTGNLDEANTKNILEILVRLAHDENYCVIIVTHDAEVSEKTDAVLRMKDGALTVSRK